MPALDDAECEDAQALALPLANRLFLTSRDVDMWLREMSVHSSAFRLSGGPMMQGGNHFCAKDMRSFADIWSVRPADSPCRRAVPALPLSQTRTHLEFF